jgi:hypothetical protein
MACHLQYTRELWLPENCLFRENQADFQYECPRNQRSDSASYAIIHEYCQLQGEHFA